MESGYPLGCTVVHTEDPSFEWDLGKAMLNLDKHRVDFADCIPVFEDPWALQLEDQHEDGEERHVVLGSDALLRVVRVVYRWRGERIRMISAKEATRRERRLYRGNR